MRAARDVTLLWALRSPCSAGCTYCYFGSLEEHREAPPTRPGQLSHLPDGDLHPADVARFLSDVRDSGVRRVFLAGGEPLIWAPIGDVVRRLTDAQVEVVVCTNGVPLNKPRVRELLLDTGVAAVSVSLDSADPVVNDTYRPFRNGVDGWHTVVSGIRALLADRGRGPGPRIGMYTVLTRRTLPGLLDTARLAADLGVDYFVPQPVALAADHPQAEELRLRAQDSEAVADALNALYNAGLSLALPQARYPALVLSTIAHPLQTVRGCFGGHQLAFIQPDGSVWDCPSSHRIAHQVARGEQRSIAGRTAAATFPPVAVTGGVDCPLFSDDCVNMVPLMDFGRFLPAPTDTTIADTTVHTSTVHITVKGQRR